MDSDPSHLPTPAAMPPQRTVLSVSGLTGPARSPVIHDVSLSLRAREIAVVIGPIQSGKSTLMRHLLGLEIAERGTVTVDSITFDAADPAPGALRRARARIGTVFESSALLRNLTITENVELPLLEHAELGGAAARQRARELLREVGLDLPDDAIPERLGRAEQRRVALARALALQPAVLLLDEPTAGFDAASAHGLDDLLERLRQSRGFGVMIFSHEVRHAFAHVPRAASRSEVRGVGAPESEREIMVMEDGAIVAHGPLDALLGSTVPVVRSLLHRRTER